MRILVWQWGRRGAGPLFAAGLAEALDALDGVAAMLSLSTGAEILGGPAPPRCAFSVPTYGGLAGLALRTAQAPLMVRSLTRRVRALAPDVAICAMPAVLDLAMMAALKRACVPAVVIVHDAESHPGDGLPFQMALQRRQIARADALVALTAHVAERLREQGARAPLLRAVLPPLVFGPPPPPPGSHGGGLRLLCFGRLLPYKGLDLLAGALRLVPGAPPEVRVVGAGPEGPELAALRAVPGVLVENRWVPEAELAALLAWADALVLPYREASQSGVAAAAIAAGRWVIATKVGGLVEQLAGERLARLAAPNAEAIAAAIARMRDDPPQAGPPADPRSAWRDMAKALLAKIAGVPGLTTHR